MVRKSDYDPRFTKKVFQMNNEGVFYLGAFEDSGKFHHYLQGGYWREKQEADAAFARWKNRRGL